ncbi:MAG: hypothetical protein WBG92_22985 [Thiohalocapsa sp.]
MAAADLDKAAARVENEGKPGTFAELARIARELDLNDKVPAMIDKAQNCCGDSARAARALATRLLEDGFDREQVKQIFGNLKAKMANTAERLGWAESVVDLFGDQDLAREEFAELEEQADEAIRPSETRAIRSGHFERASSSVWSGRPYRHH